MSLGFIRPVVPQAPKAAPLEIATVSRPTRRPSYLLLCALSALVVTFASLFGWAYASWRYAAYCEDLVANGAWVSATTCDNATHCLGTDGIYYTGALSEHDCHSYWSETLSTTSGDRRRRQMSSSSQPPSQPPNIVSWAAVLPPSCIRDYDNLSSKNQRRCVEQKEAENNGSSVLRSKL